MKIYDSDIREKLYKSFLEVDEYINEDDTIVIDELDVCQGIVRVDVAVVNGSMHGYEIKSKQDNLERLPLQMEFYNQVFDTMTIVVFESHLDKVKELVPDWWGIIAVYEDCGEVEFKSIRLPKENSNINIENVAMFLWRDEMIDLLLTRGNITRGYKSKSRSALSKMIEKNVKPDVVQEYVRNALKNRPDWRAVPIQQIYGD